MGPVFASIWVTDQSPQFADSLLHAIRFSNEQAVPPALREFIPSLILKAGKTNDMKKRMSLVLCRLDIERKAPA